MDIEQTYQDTLNYLYGFVDYSLTRGGFKDMLGKFELDRMRAFLEYLGHPEQAYPIIHVAGTKGKGSVCALCASALQAAGYRVGLYTSPHLQDYAERIVVDGQPIPHADLVALVDEIRPYLDQGTQLTTFEITTGLAFRYFARQGATAVVAEVGLGGRLDATNVVTPLVSVITSISYDHTQVLGDTLALIAGEKAGIIKPGCPVVVAPQPEEARAAIERIAAERQAPAVWVGQDIGYEALAHSLDGQSLRVWRVGAAAEEQLETPLLGAHQVQNAATAWAALQTASQQGLVLPGGSIPAGFKAAVWPGRFEILRRPGSAGAPPVVVDSAHNRDSAARLRAALQDYFPGKPVVLIFGVSEDKDIPGMLAELLPVVSQVVTTKSFHPRALDPQELQTLVAAAGQALGRAVPVTVTDSVEAALDQALGLAGAQALVLATGSIFVAAGIREVWRERENPHA